MSATAHKYFDDQFHRDPQYDRQKKHLYTLDFNNRVQQWQWFGELDRNNSRILRNFTNYASDTYLAIDQNNLIVGGYSFILESGYEGKALNPLL